MMSGSCDRMVPNLSRRRALHWTATLADVGNCRRTAARQRNTIRIECRTSRTCPCCIASRRCSKFHVGRQKCRPSTVDSARVWSHSHWRRAHRICFGGRCRHLRWSGRPLTDLSLQAVGRVSGRTDRLCGPRLMLA